MRTIIQHIGPLYGEANTGTVFGQPNGSIAVGQGYSPAPTPEPTPEIEQIWQIIQNQRAIYYRSSTSKTSAEIKYLISDGSQIYGVSTNNTSYTYEKSSTIFSTTMTETVGNTSAVMRIQIATDEDFNNIVAQASQTAGNFSTQPAIKTTYTIVSGTTYYVRLALFDGSGNYLYKISNTLIYTGVVF